MGEREGEKERERERRRKEGAKPCFWAPILYVVRMGGKGEGDAHYTSPRGSSS